MFVNNGKCSTPSERRCKVGKGGNETLDSGFFSPITNTDKMDKDPTLLSADILQISPMKLPLSPSKIKTENIMSEMTDISISEEWEKDFFSNFEENLFNMDLDDRMLTDILKSPKGKAAMNEMIRSPKGKAFVDRMMKSPKGKLMKNQLDYGFTNLPLQCSPQISDAKKLSATPMKPEIKGMLKMSNSKRRLAMTDPNIGNSQGRLDNECMPHNILRRPKTEFVPIQPKENIQPIVWPSKERLKFARAQFTRTLANAVQRVSQEASNIKRVKFQEPFEPSSKPDKYPEIKQALERPAGQVKSSKAPFSIRIEPLYDRPNETCVYVPFMENNDNETSSYYNYDDDSDDDETWTAELPFSQKRTRSSNGQSKRKKYSKYRS